MIGREGRKKAGSRPAFPLAADPSMRYCDSTYLTSALTSSGLDLTAGCPSPLDSFAVSVASASALPLYLAAISLKPGPTFFEASTLWQLRQPALFASASCALAALEAANAIDATTAIAISFIQPP